MAESNVDNKHKKFVRKEYSRQLVRDALEGSDAVKRASEVYLPMPDGMRIDDTAMQSQNFSVSEYHRNRMVQDKEYTPYYHRNPAYRAYLQRARFPDITKHTLRGLVGTATQKPLQIKLPASIAHLEESATLNGHNMQELFEYCLSEVLTAGGIDLAVEISPEDNLPYIAPYTVDTRRNWRYNDKIRMIEMIVFYYEEETEGDNKFENSELNVAIVYSWETMDEDLTKAEFFVAQTRYEDDEEVTSIIPSLQGNMFEEIPVVPIGAEENCLDPQSPPLLGIAEIAMSIYRKDADVSNAEYMTCNPNLVISGMSAAGGVPNVVGSTVAIILENPQAKAVYTQTDTSALDHMDNKIKALFEEAMLYGASLVGPSKKGVEAVETVKSRQASQGATLVESVKNLVKGMEEACEICATIKGANKDQVEIVANTDFSDKSLSPQMLQALNSIAMVGNISQDSFLNALFEAGYIDDVEKEKARIAAMDFGTKEEEEEDEDAE